MHQNSHPSLEVRSRSSIYNCFGMVFASRRTWVRAEDVPTILSDDGYRPTTRNESEYGDIVLYRDGGSRILHVALVIRRKARLASASFQITVLSQWGRDGEFFHDLDDVMPNLGKPSDFWTDREVVV